MYQQIAWQLTVILVAVVIVGFAFVALKSKKRAEYEPIQKKGYRIRTVYFFGLVFVLLTAITLTMKDLPFSKTNAISQGVNAQAEAPFVIDVDSVQFGWKMSATQAVVGQPIEFRVTSSDVNHGFAIYDENMTLLAQTQAMPEYTNVLRYTFTKPGTYQILCLEYCGVGHHFMVSDFEVVEK